MKKVLYITLIVFISGCGNCTRRDRAYNKAIYYYHKSDDYYNRAIIEINISTVMIGRDSGISNIHKKKSDSLIVIGKRYMDTAYIWTNEFYRIIK